MNTHTPTPWKQDAENLAAIIDSLDNAEFIVRAVNSHEELLAAAKIGLSYMNPQEQTIYGSDKKFVEASIAKAEVKP